MSHKMGLAKITPTEKTVTQKITWNFTAPQTVHTTYTEVKSGTGSVTASTDFNSTTQLRLCNNSGYWTIVKATGTNTNEPITLGTVTTVADSWLQPISDIGYGKYKNFNVQSSRTFQLFEANFPYNSSKTYYMIILPWHGPYKLEVWGASCSTYYGTPGIGGYTYGTYTIDQGESKNLYVCVGGAGTSGSSSSYASSTSYAGYNGGGYGQEGGGGATHIAQTLVGTGVLSDYSSTASQTYILVVAGGAGNADLGTGGNGGGGNNDGGDGILGGGATGYGRGGTQSKGGQGYGNTSPGNGSFGQGGSIAGTGDMSAAGGGGWYGGGSSTISNNGPGGGGSGHVNTSKITNYGGTTGGATIYANGVAKISM